ncbi:metallophosphoesterase [Desulfotruncus alcoholivorax]|uniref:metallophosphoesterase n=1 Tax=Desulfotruncus alcoholivorax TaxID=265477 RepID=UPI0004223B29|nr:metallophosphoesterase [Desulfotruncus alcoholivorax]
MPAVVAISDLHLGEESSALNPLLGKVVPPILQDDDAFKNPPQNPTPYELNILLHKIAWESGGIAEVVLVGDIIDLTLAAYSDCLLQAREFFRLIFTGLSPGAVVWVPGNHDHHIWLQVCEEEYIKWPLLNEQLPREYPRITGPGKETGAFNSMNFGVRFLLNLLPPFLRGRFWLAYPNYVTTCGEKTILFHHGHFFDRKQSWIGANVIQAQNLSELEMFNSSYLEFIMYGSGQSGRLSEQIENAYEEFRWLLEKMGHVLDYIAIRKIFQRLFGNLKKGGDRNATLGSGLSTRIEKYLQYIESERELAPEVYPPEFSLVFGHTHRPVHGEQVGNCQVYNAGGWTVDELWPGRDNLRSNVFVAVPGKQFEVRQFSIRRDIYDFCHNLNAALRDAVKINFGAVPRGFGEPKND